MEGTQVEMRAHPEQLRGGWRQWLFDTQQASDVCHKLL